VNLNIDGPPGPDLLPAFDVRGFPIGHVRFPYFHPGIDQSILLTTLVAGPIPVAPGVPVEAILGFRDSLGNPIGPSSQVSLSPGQTASLDFAVSQFEASFPSGESTAILPVVTPLPGSNGFSGELLSSVEVIDDLAGFGMVFVPGIASFPDAPVFAPQGLAAGQSMRITVFAFPPDPCLATLGFLDNNGAPIGPTRAVNLTGGQSASLTLNFDTLGRPRGIAGRIEIQPQVTLTPAAAAAAQVPVGNSCPASVDVVNNLTGRTWTHQSGLPAVQ